jgi:hypothetical protein
MKPGPRTAHWHIYNQSSYHMWLIWILERDWNKKQAGWLGLGPDNVPLKRESFLSSYFFASKQEQASSLIFCHFVVILISNSANLLLWMKWDLGFCCNENMMMKIIILVLGKDKGLNTVRRCMGVQVSWSFLEPSCGVGWGFLLSLFLLNFNLIVFYYSFSSKFTVILFYNLSFTTWYIVTF